MNFIYPGSPGDQHREIVRRMLRGEFIHIGNEFYELLVQNSQWYKDFFKNSFDIDLAHKYEIFYCISPYKGSKYTKEILTVIAVMMYEINKLGGNPVDSLRSEEFTIEKIKDMISGSVQFSRYSSIIDARFINKLEGFGILKKFDSERFVFTGAIDIFINEFDSLREQVPALEDQPEP